MAPKKPVAKPAKKTGKTNATGKRDSNARSQPIARPGKSAKKEQISSRFEQLFDRVKNLSVQGYAPDGTVVYWNKASERLYGYSKNEALGKKLYDLIIPPAMRKGVKKAVQEMIRSGKGSPPAKLVLQHKNGSPVYVYSNHTVVREPGSQPELFCIDIDLKTQRKFEEKLGKIHFDLRERMKELNCLYKVSQLMTRRLKLPALLLEAAQVIPTGWLDPARTTASIEWDGTWLGEGPVQKSRYSMLEKREVQKGKWLKVLVAVKPDTGKNVRKQYAFLPEEKDLLKALADQLALLISKKLAEEDSAEQESLLKEAQRVAKLGSWSYDLVRDKLFWSDSLYELFDTDARHFNNKYRSFIEFVVPEDRERVLAVNKQAKKSGGEFHVEYRIRTARNKEKHIEEFGYAERNKQGKIIRLYGTAQDITSRWLAEQTIKDSENRYRTLFDASPLVGYILEIKTLRILDVNQATVDFYGYSREELLGMTILKLRPPSERKKLKQTIQLLDTRNENLDKDIFLHCKKDGTLAHMEISARILTFQGKRCMLVMASDVTSRILQEELGALERELMENSLRKEVGLEKSITGFLLQVEKLFPGILTSILRVKRGAVYNLTSPSLPEFYSSALNGLLIGPVAGSCGTAAFQRKTVIVADIENDPLWKPYKELAGKAGLRSCWSQPIFNKKDQVCATFAIYSKQVRIPGEEELLYFSRIRSVISMLLEKEASDIEIEDKQNRIEFITRATTDIIWDYNFEEQQLFMAEGFRTQFGFDIADPETNYKNWKGFKHIHPDDRERVAAEMTEALFSNEITWEGEYRVLKADKSIAYVSDHSYILRKEDGQPYRSVGALRDISKEYNERQQVRLMEIVSKTFNREDSLAPALKLLLRELVGFGDFSAAEIWLLSRDGKQFTLIASHASGKKEEDYYRENQALNTLSPEGGLLKYVFEKKEMVLVPDLLKDASSRRRQGLLKSGLRSALALPLLYEGQLIGSLTILTDKDANHLESFRQLLRGLENDLGSEIHRKQLENELTLIFDTVPDIIAVAGLDGYFKKINPAASRILGYAEVELMSRPSDSFLHPDFAATQKRENQRMPAPGVTEYTETCYLSKSGKAVWLAWTYRLLPGEDQVFAVAKDITAQRYLQQQLQDTYDQARIGTWEVNLLQQTLTWSSVTRQIHEVEEAFVPDLDAAIRFYREDYRDKVREVVDLAIRTGQSWDFEFPLITARNNEKWVRAQGNAEFSEGQCVRLYGVFQDITKLKDAERRLRQSTENIPGVIYQYFLYPDGRDEFRNISGAVRNVLGLDPEEAEKDSARVWAMIHKEDVPMLRETVMYSALHLKKWNTQWRMNLPDGRMHWLECHATPHRMQNGTVYFDAVLFDITEKKETEHLLEQVTELSMIGGWELKLQKDGGRLHSSPITRKILDAGEDYAPSFEEAIEIYPEEYRATVQQAVQELMDTGKPYDIECEVITLKNSRKWVRCIGNAERDAQGKCLRIFGSIQDIDARKKAEMELQRQTLELKASNAELEQFAYVASHDLQEPLRMVTSFLTKLEEKYNKQLDDKARQYIGFAVDGASRMRQTILDLLQYARIGKGDARPEQIDVNTLLDEIMLLYRDEIENCGAAITRENLPVLRHYQAPLMQVLSNLVNNALKYRREDVKPEIMVSASQNGEEWLFCVSDNGIGIEKEYLQKIFVIFQRLHPKATYSGTGIGLAVVRKIIESLGGRVWAESKPDHGTNFYFTIKPVKGNHH